MLINIAKFFSAFGLHFILLWVGISTISFGIGRMRQIRLGELTEEEAEELMQKAEIQYYKLCIIFLMTMFFYNLIK